MSERRTDGYLPIEDYAVIGNLRSIALVGLDGSIDWCCLPELENPSLFAALLDARKGGHFSVALAAPCRNTQHYQDRTNVLETCFISEQGRLKVIDFMPLLDSIEGAGDPDTAPEIHRLLTCEEGEAEAVIEWAPRFDYARAIPRIEQSGNGFVAKAGGEQLLLSGLRTEEAEIRDTEYGPVLRGRVRLKAGEQRVLVTRYGPQEGVLGLAESLAALDSTCKAWLEWSELCERPGTCEFGGPWHDLLVRSTLALKLLTHPTTGAIAAAATTSLPEKMGGVRNWDYRYAWIRDSSFTSQALFVMGHRAEARDFLNWIHGICSEKAEPPFHMQIMYGLHGETDLTEHVLGHLEGYRKSQPVRIGNGAAKQEQHDIYGELLGSAYELLRMGGQMKEPMLHFLSQVADEACDKWREPDYGIWEVRGGARHFVYSKVMVWVALDRAVRMAERWNLPGNVQRWRRNREEVRQAVLEQGYDEKRDAFVQSFGSTSLDASNLLIPVVEFLPFSDPRVQNTIDRTLDELTESGLVHRYNMNDDGLPGGEGAFGLTTFWMIDALALSGRLDEAREMFEKIANRANHVGLYAEEFDPDTGAFLGNFPQAFSHVGFINSALYLGRAGGEHYPAPSPVGSPEHAQETGHSPDGVEQEGVDKSR